MSIQQVQQHQQPDSLGQDGREEAFNIVQLDSEDVCAGHPSIHAAMAAIRDVNGLQWPAAAVRVENSDVLNFLGSYFGFQRDNIRNQREHLALLLANAHIRHPCDILVVAKSIRGKLLENYEEWCSFLGQKSNVSFSGTQSRVQQLELLYISLYLLIWGEAANLRFLPECLCCIFHHMAADLSRILEGNMNRTSIYPAPSATFGENGFLKQVVTPIYKIIEEGARRRENGRTSHSKWMNYDDVNEYFWSKRCLKYKGNLCSVSAAGVFLVHGKNGFVERRTFWNIYRSFDRLWVMLTLFLQAMMITAWYGGSSPWEDLQKKDVQLRCLTVFTTWAGLQLLSSVLDVATQYKLVRAETYAIGVRMVLKTVISAFWVVGFFLLHSRAESQWRKDGWSPAANQKLDQFLLLVLLFVCRQFLSLVLFFFPTLDNMNQMKSWKMTQLGAWWFNGGAYVGRNVREGFNDTIKYTALWVVILGFKFLVSYFFQIKPVITKTKKALNVHVDNVSKLEVGILWLPVIMLYFMDLHIWYSLFSALLGGLLGLLSHIGIIRSIDQVRDAFSSVYTNLQRNLFIKEDLPKETMSEKFANVWNEIMQTFREEDIISDSELELLELPFNSWKIAGIRWPCFLLSGELSLAIVQAAKLDCSDELVWKKICKNEYRRCAVVETYHSIQELLKKIVRDDTEEWTIISNFFKAIDQALQEKNFTKMYKAAALKKIHAKLATLVDLLNKGEVNISAVIYTLQSLYHISAREFMKVGNGSQMPKSDELLFRAAIKLPVAEDTIFYKNLRRLRLILNKSISTHNFPTNSEAKRRIASFCNSLLMRMPAPPQIKKMLSFSVLTPYFDEDILYSTEQLRTENEDGVSALFYLQKVYEDEWENFKERMARKGMHYEEEIWSEDLRLWASYRGQTLIRTVKGMMYYKKALELQQFLERPFDEELCPAITKMKFTYVITCQNYGTHKANGDPRVKDIQYLMTKNEDIRVAYVDKAMHEGENTYYSVLVKYDQQLQREVEIYRIMLPGPFVIGEGKPENQNHAIIFTRGDAVQAIDMNQDAYFEDALKMRNLLEEFNDLHGIRKPTILGIREYVFTGSVSSLASLMSIQEMSFVTLGQRMLANPLKVRMHYGHSDIFDRLWFITHGGISKASRVININEDVFAGFNCTLRGGNVTHHEYVQVGKGRDVGLSQITNFEAKVAGGNGEQLLSRDVYRLGHSLDFFRMLSFYHTAVGYYFNNLMIILIAYVFLYGRLFLRDFSGNSSSNGAKAFSTIIDERFILQLGLFAAIPMIIEKALQHTIMETMIESGLISAILEFVAAQLQLATFFFTFSLGTKAHYFGSTILHGGAKYRATGRGFGIGHKRFSEIYRDYARSHFIKALELGFVLLVYASLSTQSRSTVAYLALTTASWILVVSWIMAPFVFNPLGFDWLKTVNDFEDFMKWIWHPAWLFTSPDKSWRSWFCEERDYKRTTGPWGQAIEIILCLRFFLLQYVTVRQGSAAEDSNAALYILSWIFPTIVLGICATVSRCHTKYGCKNHLLYRCIVTGIFCITTLSVILLQTFNVFKCKNLLKVFVAFIPAGWGILSITLVLRPRLSKTCEILLFAARLYDLLFGLAVIAPVAVLSWMPGVQSMQTRILFNQGFSRGLQISSIIAGKK